MPPVLGPVSPSPTRLKSCAGSSGTTVSPSTTQNSDTSGPSRNDSSSTGCPPSSRFGGMVRATSRSAVTTTPLPAASPSSLTTQACWPAVNRSGPARRPDAPGCRRSRWRRCGTPAAAMTSLANALEPSMRAASFDGPKHAMPAARTASATPSTRGTSGPMTTRSASHCRASFTTASPEADVDVVLIGDQRGAGVAGRDGQGLDAGVLAQGEQQRHVHGHRIRSRGRARRPPYLANPGLCEAARSTNGHRNRRARGVRQSSADPGTSGCRGRPRRRVRRRVPRAWRCPDNPGRSRPRRGWRCAIRASSTVAPRR